MERKHVWAICQGHDGSGLGKSMGVVAEKGPGKCMRRLNWNGKIDGTNISQSEWYKMGISKFCGILKYSVIGWLKLEGRTSSSLISRQGRPRSSTLLSWRCRRKREINVNS